MPEEPEIILRQQFYLDCTGDDDVPKPSILLLANPAGLRLLADLFSRLADDSVTPFMAEMGDADDHQHITPLGDGIERLSDDIELRLGKMTPEHRDVILMKYGIGPANARRGSLIAQYNSIIGEIELRMEQESA